MRLFAKIQFKHGSLHAPFALYTFDLSKTLCLLALSNAGVDAAHCPDGGEDGKHAQCDDDWLPVTCRPWVVVCYNQVTVPEVIDQVDGSETKCCAAKCVHEGPVQAGRVVDERDGSGELDVGSALGQNDTEVDTAVGDAFAGSGTFEEGNLESVCLASGQLAQVARKIGVPANAEAVFPGTENGVTGLQLKQRLLLARAELRGGNVANVVGKVRIDGTGMQV
jgi:hypothetical protein